MNAFSASLRSAAFTRLLGLAELGTVELAIVELGTGDLGTVELDTAELGPLELGTVELGPTELGALAEAGVAAVAGGGLDCLKIFDICVY